MLFLYLVGLAEVPYQILLLFLQLLKVLSLVTQELNVLNQLFVFFVEPHHLLIHLYRSEVESLVVGYFQVLLIDLVVKGLLQLNVHLMQVILSFVVMIYLLEQKHLHDLCLCFNMLTSKHLETIFKRETEPKYESMLIFVHVLKEELIVHEYLFLLLGFIILHVLKVLVHFFKVFIT
mmetsp:Transcript_21475/g.20640  ORF Transcript_21475/g.20640 Transcript_21475/m.20640 type:complete len:177 (+) Transcript_21475:148-678(+)